MMPPPAWVPEVPPPAPAVAPAVPAEPLKHAEHHYESLSRFTATVQDGDGDPIVFVITRQGLRWRLTDIRLPL